MLGNHFFMLHHVVYIYLSKSFFYQLKDPQHLKFQVFELNRIQFQKVPNLKNLQAFIEILKEGKKPASTKLWVTSFIHVFKAI